MMIEIKAQESGAILPAKPTDEQLLPWGFANVVDTTPPAYNNYIEQLREGAPENIDGVYYQTWTTIPIPTDQVKSRKLNELKEIQILLFI